MSGRPRNPLDETSFAGRFAARLRKLREKRGLLVAEVAERADASASTIWRWESATASPMLTDLPKIAAALGCRVRDLFPDS